jgi:tyrosyl-tRNA synthetase
MGRQEGKDTISSSQILYAVMQCADIFFLDVDCTQLGLDQRRVNVMGREFAERTDRTKPIIISHHMLSGLKKNQEKMSKSDPESAIFMEDSAEDVARKIKSAYCSPGEIAGNPVLEYYKYIVFPSYDDKIVIQTAIGAVEYSGYASLEAAFEGQQVHPKELKDALTKYINELIEPVRRHFAENKEARDLVQRVRSYQVTR